MLTYVDLSPKEKDPQTVRQAQERVLFHKRWRRYDTEETDRFAREGFAGLAGGDD